VPFFAACAGANNETASPNDAVVASANFTPLESFIAISPLVELSSYGVIPMAEFWEILPYLMPNTQEVSIARTRYNSSF
jgi:hypothetical protein